MKEGFIKDAYELLLKELQTILSLSYLFMVAIGMLFNYQKYDEFGINIFQYAGVFEFLIAPFEDFRIVGFTLFSLALPLLLIRIDLFWKTKYPNSYTQWSFGMDKKPWYGQYRIITFSAVFIWYIFLASNLYGRFVKKRIESYPVVSLRFSDNQLRQGIMLGKTKEVVFLWQGGRTTIIPITSVVKEIEIKQAASAGRP